MLASSASIINCVGGATLDNPTELTRSDISDVIASLMSNNAYTITSGIEGEDRFGTAPVRNAFMAFTSTALIPSLENVNGFISNIQYPANYNALYSEWGSVLNVRFLVSSIGSVAAKKSDLGATVYNTFITGLEAYANVVQDNYSDQFIYLPPIFSGPLALNATVGYKFGTCPKILNDAWITNLCSVKLN